MSTAKEKNERNALLNSYHTENDDNTLYLYTDGSRQLDSTGDTCVAVSGAFIIVKNTEVLCGYKFVSTEPQLVSLWNVGSEMMIFYLGLAYLNYFYPECKNVVVFHDYMGVARWTQGEWKIKENKTHPIVKHGRNLYLSMVSQDKKINFIHVTSHSSTKNYACMFNHIVDELAGNVSNAQDISERLGSVKNMKMISEQELDTVILKAKEKYIDHINFYK